MKSCNIVLFFIVILISFNFLTPVRYVNAQVDSVVYTEDLIISHEKQTGFDEIDGVNKIVFINKDSLIIQKMNGTANVTGTNINKLTKASFETGSHWFLGALVGGCTGGTIGFIIALASADKSDKLSESVDKGFKAVMIGSLGMLIGSVTGGIIGYAIKKYDYLNIGAIPKKDKQVKLIRFIRQHK